MLKFITEKDAIAVAETLTFSKIIYIFTTKNTLWFNIVRERRKLGEQHLSFIKGNKFVLFIYFKHSEQLEANFLISD